MVGYVYWTNPFQMYIIKHKYNAYVYIWWMCIMKNMKKHVKVEYGFVHIRQLYILITKFS